MSNILVLLDVPNYTVTRVEENTTTITILYVLLLIGYIVGCYYINKSKKIDYKNLSLDNTYLIVELALLPTLSALVGINYLGFSIYVLMYYLINVKYEKLGYKESIHTQDELVKAVTIYYFKEVLLMIPISAVIAIFCEYSVIGYFFIFLLASLLAAFYRIMVNVKEEETYKLMTNDAIVKKLGQNFDTNTLFRNLFQIYIQIQKNLTSNTIDNVSYFLEPDMLAFYKNLQGANVSKKVKDIIEEENYLSGGLIDFIVTNNIQTFKVEIVFNAKKYKANIETGSVVEGSSMHIRKYTYLLDFNLENGIYKLASERKFKEE